MTEWELVYENMIFKEAWRERKRYKRKGIKVKIRVRQHWQGLMWRIFIERKKQ